MITSILLPNDNRAHVKVTKSLLTVCIASLIGGAVTKTWNNVGLEIISEIVLAAIHNTYSAATAETPLYMEIQKRMMRTLRFVHSHATTVIRNNHSTNSTVHLYN